MSNCDHEYVMVEPERYYCPDCSHNQLRPKLCIRCYGLNVIIAHSVSSCARCGDSKTNPLDSKGWIACRRITKAIKNGATDLSDPLVNRY